MCVAHCAPLSVLITSAHLLCRPLFPLPSCTDLAIMGLHAYIKVAMGLGFELQLTKEILKALPGLLKTWSSPEFRIPCPSLVEMCIETLLLASHKGDVAIMGEALLTDPRLTKFADVLLKGDYSSLLMVDDCGQRLADSKSKLKCDKVSYDPTSRMKRPGRGFRCIRRDAF